MKKRFIVTFAVLIALAVGCATYAAITPEPQPGDPPNLHGRAASGRNGVVAAARPEASQVGVDILKMGGNAVDAAVATAFALGVVEPQMSGLGGDGFMLIKLADMDEAVFIDFRITAPGASFPQMFLGHDGRTIPAAQTITGLTIGTPGDVAGLLYAFDNFGSGVLSRQQIMQPAIDLAENGFVVTQTLHELILNNLDRINASPATSAIYTDYGLPLETGDIIRNPDLANTLRAIARDGASAFYTGPIAEKIVAAVQEVGGILTLEDLANYTPVVRRPVVGTYRGYTIISSPPVGSGITIVQMLNMLENMRSRDLAFGTPSSVNAWVHAMRFAFADRARYVADPGFVPNIPLAGMSSKAYARRLFAQFNLNEALLSASPGDPGRYDPDLTASTSSLSVMDRAGNMVTTTRTINSFFGSGVGVPGVGIIMNNQLNGFARAPGGVNSIEAFKRPRSSMSPTIVLDPRGRPFLTLGSPGSERILTAVALVISNMIDNNMTIQEAIVAPRWHTMASGVVHLEGRVPQPVIDAFEYMGYNVMVRPNWDLFFGGVHAVHFEHRRGGWLHGGADPRRDGEARAF